MSDPKICWIDLETTGSRLADSQILEIGVAITDQEGNILAEKSWLNPAPLDGLQISSLDPVVLEMHAKSGLWADLMRASLPTNSDPLDQLRPTRGIGELNRAIGTWIASNNDWSTQHIPLAGSGVSHFDRQFIRRDLPDVDRRLTYWAYDVGVTRRFLRLLGVDLETEETKPNHRALDDVKAHIAEFKAQRHYIQELQLAGPDPVDVREERPAD